MAAYLAAGIRRTTTDGQDNIYAQLVSTKGRKCGRKGIMKAMKDAGYVSLVKTSSQAKPGETVRPGSSFLDKNTYRLFS